MERKITIEESVLYKEDYQMRMLNRNQIPGILSMKGRGMNGSSLYDYDVSGKISVKAMYERSKINSEDMKMFLVELKRTINEVEKHLLNKNCILLKPEYIFYENGHFFFCYYPHAKEDFWQEFHVLTEYFVKQADYEDKECVRMTFLLHKETMEENYSLEKLIEECLKGQEIRMGNEIGAEMIPEDEMEEYPLPQMLYDTSDHDWIVSQKAGASILRETDNMWMPVKRFLNKHKKTKWGEWEGLYVEEEEF